MQVKTKINFLYAILMGIALFCGNFRCEGAVVPIGSGAYTTDLPAGQKGPSNNTGSSASPYVTANVQLPPQTNQWWSSLIWKYNPANPWSENLFPYPFSCKASAQGLGVGYTTTYTISPYVLTPSGYNSHEYHYNYQSDLQVGVAGLNSPDTKVDGYSDWAVTASWNGNARTLKATLGKGFPFIYFTVAGDKAQITPNATPTIWYNSNGVLGLTVSGHHYGIFGPAGSTWTTSGPLTSSLNGKDYFSIAVLPDNTPQTLEFYRQHAYAFVTNTSVTWDYDQAHAQLISTFNVQTILKEPGTNNVNKPLLALFRHQWKNSSNPLTTYTYLSPRGTLKVVDGSSFTTTQTFNGILPELPSVAVDGVNTYNASQLFQYVDTIYKQDPIARFNGITVGDTYWTGKAMGRLARLVQIADEIGHTAARDLFLNDLKARLQDWFDGQQQQLFYYDTKWQTLIGYPASYGSDTALNDHHFHYGYYIMAAATVAQYDPVWASENNWGGMVNLLIKDANNWDRTDTRFPFLRTFDIYEGHGWANGPAAFTSGNNQESSSESMNFSAATILWGAMTNKPEIRDLGIFLYTLETAAIEQYWFDIDDQVFPPEWREPTLGILWGNGGAYVIWWNGRIEEVHGINFLPVTIGSLYLGRNPAYLDINQSFMEANGGTTADWIDIHMAVKALYNPAEAITTFNSNPNYSPETGESKAHTYHWIHNLNTLGKLDTTVTADQPIYAVFDKNGAKSYVAYNPGDQPLLVNFSDGRQLSLAPHELKSSTGGSTPPPSQSFVQGADDLDGGQVKFWFQSTPASSSVTLNYQVNSGAQQTVAMTQTVSNWEKVVPSINTGDILTYSFTYVIDGVSKQTPQFQHTYSIDHGFTQSATSASGGIANISFKSNQPSTSVTLNYQVNANPQQQVAMTQTSTDWKSQISQLSNGDIITYSFAYVQNGQSYTTPNYTHTYNFTPPSTGFTQSITSYAWGNAGITFIPSGTASFVDIHYIVNTGSQQNIRMLNNNGTWTHFITNLKNNDAIKYWFTYSQDGKTTDTQQFQYTYQETTTPPPPNGPYTQQVDAMTNGRASFTFVPNSPATSVILHYVVNTGGQLNVNMTNTGTNWNYVVSGLKTNDVISYSYTYTISGKTYKSVNYKYTYTTDPTPPPNSNYTQSVSQASDGSATFTFTPASTASSVVLHYAIDGGAQTDVPMTNASGNWTYKLTGLSNGNVVNYTYTYVINGSTFNSNPHQFTYNAGTPPPPNSNYTQSVSQANNGSATFTFTPASTASSVVLHYAINGGAQTDAAMANAGSNWTYTLTGLSNGNVVNYTYTYVINGSTFNSNPHQFTYTTTTNPPPTNGFTQSVDQMSNGTATVNFIPGSPADWVDLHYTVNTGGQLNVKMTNNSGTWKYLISKLNNNDVVDYWFTYSINGSAKNSEHFKFTYNGGTTPPPPSSNYTQSVSQASNGSATFTFTPASTASSVVLHYAINGGAQTDTPMTNVNSNWTYTLSGLTNGNVVNYTYTYVISGSTYNSAQHQFTYNGGTTPPPSGSIPRFDHIVIVIEENHSEDQILRSGQAPYLTSLADNGAQFTNSFAIARPSQPNYLAIFFGSTLGVTDNNAHPKFDAPDLGSELIKAGFTFVGYSEDLPYAGFDGSSSGKYARRHNAWTQAARLPPEANQPFTAFPKDFNQLPTVSFVVPNVDHDAHDGTIPVMDQWLKDNLGAYAEWAKTHNSLLIVTFDENAGTDPSIPTVFYGAHVKPGDYAETINHYNVLRTIEDAYGLPRIGESATANPIVDVWN